jgi:hypothetical protein
MHLDGVRLIFVVTGAALYLNIFVLVARFSKVTGDRHRSTRLLAFVVTHLIIIVLFVVLGRAAVKGFRTGRAAMAG